MKRKILIFILCFSTLFLCFVIPSFADANEGFLFEGESYVFDSRLNGSVLLPSTQDFSFRSNDVLYTSITTQYRGYILLFYDDTEVYNQGGWVDESYRTIVSTSNQVLPYDLSIFLSINEAPFSIYDTVFDLIRSAVFGSRSLSDFETLSVTLLSILFCVLVVTLPIIVVFILIKFFIGSFMRW